MNRNIVVPMRTIVLGSIVAIALVTLSPFIIHATSALADSGPTLTINAVANVPGAPATITGAGFAAGESVLVNFGAHSATATADTSGNISGVSLPIPTVPAGLQFVSGFGETSGKWGLAYLWVAGFNPIVSPNSYYILPGAALSFTGTGFAPNETVTAVYGTHTLGTFTTDASGNFVGAASSSLPVSLSNTTATIAFTGAKSGAHASIVITIGQLFPSITPSTWYTGAGSTISLTGSGFASHEIVNVSVGSKNASSTADTNGSFAISSITLPKAGGGPLSITATGAQSGASVSVSIYVTTVSPWITFSTYWAQGGSPLVIYGNNFAAGEQVGVSSPSGSVGTTTADTSGNFAFATTVPFAPSGSLTITATGADSTAQTSSALTVAPVYANLQLSSYAGAPGTAITFIGTGYLPNEPMQVTTDRTGSTMVASFTTDASGSFGGSYTVPSTFTGGSLVLTVKGMHSFDTKSITYFVTGI